jgi:hypothetical protein
VRAEPTTYKELSDALELTPGNTIHQITKALEHLMKKDAANEHSFIAAFMISRAWGGLPAPGFFDIAQRVGRFDGDHSGPEAAAFCGSNLRLGHRRRPSSVNGEVPSTWTGEQDCRVILFSACLRAHFPNICTRHGRQ